MLNVTEAQKTAFKTSSIDTQLDIYFPSLNLHVYNDQVAQENMVIKEALMSGDNIEFVGCIASSFSTQIYNVQQNLKGQAVIVTMNRGETGSIPLFRGIVDSVQMQSSKAYKTITAYDALYTKGQIDIANWYNSLTFPITIKNFRNSLFSYIGLTQKAVTLPNDDISIIKQYEPKTLQCLPVLKYLCQINGCFGIINRNGLFEYRFIHNAYEPLYPAVTLFPANDLYPREYDPEEGGGGVSDNFAYYKSIDYQEYLVNPVQRLQIRASEDDAGVTVGNASGNKYIIQNNMFAYGQDTNTLTTMAKRIWKKIANITFHPCDTENMGLPYIEVGDVVSYALPNRNRRSVGDSSYLVNKFNVMSREMHGIQGIMDSYIAEGEQEQSEFITDVQAQLETIKRNGVNMDDYYTKEEIDTNLEDNYWTAEQTQESVVEIADIQLSEMEIPTGFNIESVYTLPSGRQANTLYLVQGGIVIVR